MIPSPAGESNADAALLGPLFGHPFSPKSRDFKWDRWQSPPTAILRWPNQRTFQWSNVKKPRTVAVYRVDIGKNIYHVVGLANDGSPVQKVKFRRVTLVQFFDLAASKGMREMPMALHARRSRISS